MANFTLDNSVQGTINNTEYKLSKNTSVGSIINADNRVMTVGTSFATLILFGATVAAGQMDETAAVEGMLINRSAITDVELQIKNGNDEIYLKLKPGRSFYLSSLDMDVDAAGGGSPTYATADSISARVGSGTAEVELLFISD